MLRDGALAATGNTTVDITPMNDAPVITSDGGGATAAGTATTCRDQQGGGNQEGGRVTV